MSGATAVLALALLGAVVGLDVVSFPQAMLSRPIVAATLAGALFGNAEAGLFTGVVLELVALETLPVGASRYPEWGSASVVGGAIAALHRDGSELSVFAVVGALATAWAGGWSMYGLRRLNGVWARQRLEDLDAGSRDAVVGLQLRGLTADLLRGGVLSAAAFVALDAIRRALPPSWAQAGAPDAVLIAIACGVALSAGWTLTQNTAGARWLFAAGVGLSLAILGLT